MDGLVDFEGVLTVLVSEADVAVKVAGAVSLSVKGGNLDGTMVVEARTNGIVTSLGKMLVTRQSTVTVAGAGGILAVGEDGVVVSTDKFGEDLLA